MTASPGNEVHRPSETARWRGRGGSGDVFFALTGEREERDENNDVFFFLRGFVHVVSFIPG